MSDTQWCGGVRQRLFMRCVFIIIVIMNKQPVVLVPLSSHCQCYGTLFLAAHQTQLQCFFLLLLLPRFCRFFSNCYLIISHVIVLTRHTTLANITF